MGKVGNVGNVGNVGDFIAVGVKVMGHHGIPRKENLVSDRTKYRAIGWKRGGW